MIALKDIAIRPKLATLLLLIGLIPLLVTGWFAARQISQAMLDRSVAQAETVLKSRQAQIESFLSERLNDARVLAADGSAVAAMEHFHQLFHTTESEKKVPGSQAWEQALNREYVTWIDNHRKVLGYHDLLLIDIDGHIVYTAARESDLGDDLNHGILKNSPLKKVFDLSQHAPAIQDFAPYAPSGYRYAAFVGAPLIRDGQTIGVVVLQLPTDPINAIMADRTGMGTTGEAYLVGKQDGITAYRSNRTLKPGKIGQPRTAGYIEAALSGRRGFEISPGSTGVMELHQYLPLNLPGLNWAVIGSVAMEEVEAPVRELVQIQILVGVLLALLVIALAFLVARSVAGPLHTINQAAAQISQGEWSARAEVGGRDELGQLAKAFNRMAHYNEEQFWIKSSVAKVTQVIQSADTPEMFASGLIRLLCPLLSAGHGAVYVLEESGHRFRLLGSYGYRERKGIGHHFAPGEGLVGQCAVEKQPIVLTEVPGDHLAITTGLGSSSPLSIMTIPLLFQERVLAVIELAAFHLFTPAQQHLMEELLPTLGLGLENLNRHQRTQRLLQQTQIQAEELATQREAEQRINETLRSQGEALRHANEELQTQSEEVRRSNEELEEQSQNLIASQEELRSQQLGLERINGELVKAHQEIERKAADLASASRYKSQFLANMSHELRTPLNSLLILARGFADNEDGNLTEEQVEAARIIQTSGQDLLELINSILDLSKVEAGKMEVQVTEVDLAELAEDLRAQFLPLADSKGLSYLVERLAGTPDHLHTDAGKLRQILRNFLANAFKFTRKGSVAVTFHTPPPEENAGRAVAITVKDTGIGIPEEKRQLIFEAFQQADGTTSRTYGGTGLGLSISLELAKLLGGEILLESTEGEGSSFTLLLPAGFGRRRLDALARSSSPAGPAGSSGSHLARGAAPHSPLLAGDTTETTSFVDHLWSPESAGRGLLVIEDDLHFAELIRGLAKRQGLPCLVATTGETGLELARRHHPRGIILDRGLPDMDGYRVLEELKRNPATHHIPVHIISARDRDEQTGLAKGAIGVLEKPVTLEQVRRVMDRLECKSTEDSRSQLLLVEHDPAARRETADWIAHDGVEVVSASNCQEAVQLLRDRRFDCMILDLGLPDCSGFALLEQLAQDVTIQKPPVVIHAGRELSREEYTRLRQYTDALVIKGMPSSGERLAMEVASFLQTVVADDATTSVRTAPVSPDWTAIFASRCVLLVDDDVRNTFALSRTLEKRGLKVIMAPDGRTALELLLHSPQTIDAVLMDVMMPGMDGNETTRRIREQERFRRVPIIGLSAKAMQEDRERCLAAGMDVFLSKPVDSDQLLALLDQLMRAGGHPA